MTPMWQDGGAKFATIFREVLVAETTGVCAWQALVQALKVALGLPVEDVDIDGMESLPVEEGTADPAMIERLTLVALPGQPMPLAFDPWDGSQVQLNQANQTHDQVNLYALLHVTLQEWSLLRHLHAARRRLAALLAETAVAWGLQHHSALYAFRFHVGLHGASTLQNATTPDMGNVHRADLECFSSTDPLFDIWAWLATICSGRRGDVLI